MVEKQGRSLVSGGKSEVSESRRRDETFTKLDRPKYIYNPNLDPVDKEKISEEEVEVAISNLPQIEVLIVRDSVKKSVDAWRMEKANLWMSNYDLEFAREDLKKQKEGGDRLNTSEVFELMTERHSEHVAYLNRQGDELFNEEFSRQVIFSSERERVARKKRISWEKVSLIKYGVDSNQATAQAEQIYSTWTELMGEEQQWLFENYPDMPLRSMQEEAKEKAEYRIKMVRNERDALVRSGMPINEALQHAGWVDSTRTELMGEEQQWLFENYPEMGLRETRREAEERAEYRIKMVRNERDALVRSGMFVDDALQQVKQKYL